MRKRGGLVVVTEFDMQLVGYFSIDGTRFNGAKKEFGLSSKTLSHNLRRLVAQGILQRSVVAGRVSYTITRKGQEFGEVLEQLQEWRERWA